MKNAFIFIGGVIAGIALTFIFSFIAYSGNTDRNDDFILFEQEGDVISTKDFKIFQVLESGNALANEIKNVSGYSMPTGLVVLFLKEDSISYYDEEQINVPSGKCAKQLGIYKYFVQSGLEKTVPIVGIRNK